MKNKFLSTFAVVFTVALCASFAASLHAQTTEEGAGPSEQPSAPMEMGRQYPQPNQPPPLDQRPPAGQQAPNAQPPMPEGQPNGPSGEAPAQTNQGVGRISMIHGDVSTQRGDSSDWSAAILNQPLLNGDKISTGPNARAEVQLDFANILRLGPGAQANIANFTKDHIQIQLGQGLANYSVFNESEAEPEIDTPNVAIHPAHKDVILRIEVRPDGDSVIIVRKGEAQISTPKGIADLKAGDLATVHGSLEEAQYKISPAPDRDDWDTWNSERDRMIHTARAWQHTNRYYTGSEDLDANGRWENVPDYGQIWVPNEPEGWAPYRDGNWVWEPYYGWTWVGNEPWGWAPYHYGRWMSYGGAWGWWPGPVWGAGFYRPFWAPAYVSFFGFGGGFGFGVGFGWGGFGWLPLGPCDWFHPWWGGYGGRFGYAGFDRFGGRFGGFAPLHGGVLYSNVAHINDAHISAGASTVAANRFGAGHTTAVAATHAQLSSAHMMTGNMPVMPSHASLSASGRAAAPSTIHNTASQHFAGTQSASRPESFSQQTSHLQSSMQQNHVSSVTAGARGSAAMESSAAESRGSESRGATSESSHSTAGASSSTSRGGWSSFNQPSHSSASENRGTTSNSASSARGESGSYWSRTAPSSSGSRTSSGSYERGGSSSRPQLNMRQPIAQPRSSGSYSGSSHSSSSHSSGGGHSGGGGHR